jgi:hypothetical protein
MKTTPVPFSSPALVRPVTVPFIPHAPARLALRRPNAIIEPNRIALDPIYSFPNAICVEYPNRSDGAEHARHLRKRPDRPIL